ncbi:hypothetical protein ElyMa_004166200 [Elysia marginata]|uniref:Uncharacterized protein n=1 Tax=Elysia marginata TaxID=1093978 RepID=A0AAV4GIL1_9GAST|nr:hypothetical protein ElyMa_004166200 [Elysia marginata]
MDHPTCDGRDRQESNETSYRISPATLSPRVRQGRTNPAILQSQQSRNRERILILGAVIWLRGMISDTTGQMAEASDWLVLPSCAVSNVDPD